MDNDLSLEPLGDVESQVIEDAQKKGIDPQIAYNQAQEESGFNPNAVGDGGQAVGVLQMHPAAAQEVGVTDRTDTAQNISGSHDYLNKYTKKYGGDVRQGLMAYNWGPGNMDNWIKNGSNPDDVPPSVKKYVNTALQGGHINDAFHQDAQPLQLEAVPDDTTDVNQEPNPNPGAPVTNAVPAEDPIAKTDVGASMIGAQSGANSMLFGLPRMAATALQTAGEKTLAPIYSAVTGKDVPGVTGQSFGDVYSKNLSDTNNQMDEEKASHPLSYTGGAILGGAAMLPLGGGGKAALSADKIAKFTQEAELEAKAIIGNFNPAVPQLTQKLLQQKVAAVTAGKVAPNVASSVPSSLPNIMAAVGAGHSGIKGSVAGYAAAKALQGAGKLISKVPTRIAAPYVGQHELTSLTGGDQDASEPLQLEPAKPNTINASDLDRYQGQLGPYYSVLKNAAAQGGNNLAVTQFVLGQKDPQFNKAMMDLQNAKAKGM